MERFWSKVKIGNPNECWEWIAGPYHNRYGIFWLHGKNISSHRMAWQIFHKKKIPIGMLVNHHCDNMRCVNPRHLYIGTNEDNNRDTVTRRRRVNNAPKGIKHSKCLLKEFEVLRIYSDKKHSYQELANIFNVSPSAVRSIRRAKTWKHITGGKRVPPNKKKY